MSSSTDRRSADAIGGALVQLTRRRDRRTEDPRVLLEQVDAARLVEMANYHRVPGVVHRSLVELSSSDSRFAGLRTASQIATLAHGRCLVELRTMSEVLSRLERPWLVVKGPVLAEYGYGDPGARLYEDLDLVVHGSDLSAAVSSIEGAGGQRTSLNWPLATRLRRAEIPMLLPAGMLADLHWELLVTPNARARFDFSVAAVTERRRTVSVGGIDVATLDAVDGLLYLCAHGALSGGHQLVWLKDLEVMVDRESPDWDVLVRRARHSRLDLVAAVLFERARMVLGAAVPSAVIEELGRRAAWWRWWYRRERTVGAARWGAYDGTGRTVVAATSGSSLASAIQLGRSMVEDSALPALRDRFGASSSGETPELYRDIGGTQAWESYLRMAGAGTA
jgi:hypothetical protein